MKRRTASCPSCGAPVTFGVGAAVSVCDFCRTLVAREDKKVEDHGRVADLVETSSRLRRGLTGKINGRSFVVAGHVQYKHPAGGVWDEWYLSFSGGRWGWLAEAQGKILLTFERQLKNNKQVPSFENLSVGTSLSMVGTEFHVFEQGTAICASAEGEIPWSFRVGGEHRFVDLQDQTGRVATIEFNTPVRIFVGKEVSLDELHLSGEGWDTEASVITSGALQLNCPKCAGPLVMRAPDLSLRITCPSCNSLLDADSGKLSYFKTLKSRESFPIHLPLGKEGILFGHSYTVIGYMQRYAMWMGKIFPWNEYLLHNPEVGFRWLVQNDKHWSFVQPPTQTLPPSMGEIESFRYEGEEYRLYDRGTSHVRYVLGEFYWKVEIGEKVRTADFISPPKMVSFEWSTTGNSDEVNVSVGTYVPIEEIEKSFGMKNLPQPWGVGVIQPKPWPGWGVFLLWPVFVLLLVIIHLVFSKSGINDGSDGWLCFYAVLLVSSVPGGILALLHSFEVNRWKSSDYSPYASE